MPKLKSVVIPSLAELLVNLSAGWLGVVLIFPQTWITSDWQYNLTIFSRNVFYGLLSLAISVYLKYKYDN